MERYLNITKCWFDVKVLDVKILWCDVRIWFYTNIY